MAYDPGAIDATLAAAVGDEPQLIEELRNAFLEGVERGLDKLERARDPQEWRTAAWRLKGLAASFGAIRLMAIATDAADVPPQDMVTLRKLRRAVERLSGRASPGRFGAAGCSLIFARPVAIAHTVRVSEP